MKKLLILTLITMSVNGVVAQNVMSPELLWKLDRISPLGISKDEKNIIYKVSTPSVEENNSNSKYYSVPVNGGNAVENSDYKSLLADKNVSPDGKYTVYNEEVKIDKFTEKTSILIWINPMLKSIMGWIIAIGTLGMKVNSITFFINQTMKNRLELTL